MHNASKQSHAPELVRDVLNEYAFSRLAQGMVGAISHVVANMSKTHNGVPTVNGCSVESPDLLGRIFKDTDSDSDVDTLVKSFQRHMIMAAQDWAQDVIHDPLVREATEREIKAILSKIEQPPTSP